MNDWLDRQSRIRLQNAAIELSTDELTERIAALDAEWDIERVVEAEAALVGLTGLALSVLDRRFVALPAFVASMLLLHAVQGWYPWLPIFRRMGLRSVDEIARERYAMKACRGDFTSIPPRNGDASRRAAAAWEAVCI